MMNSKVYGMLLIASIVAVVSVLISTQNAVASIIQRPDGPAYIDEEETAEAGNATMLTNETAAGNMTGTNSTS